MNLFPKNIWVKVMTKKIKENIWEINDLGYRRYVRYHHPEAIQFIKQNAEDIKNKGNIWIDVQNVTEFSDKAPDGTYLPGVGNRILFKKIVFEIFPRKMKPQYRKDDNFYNRYITWKTATEDIQKQESAGYEGEQWIVECLLDVHKTQSKIEKVHVAETHKRIDNPEYAAYLESKKYRQYKAEYEAYELRRKDYETYRHGFHDFHLPNGETVQKLLYKNPEEKFEKLKQLGVTETEIQESRQRLVKPVEPIPPPTPPRYITKVIPEHYEDRVVPGKWDWCHAIKFVHRV